MKIVFCGGATGGHFYPLIAVAEEIFDIAKERRILKPKLYYFAPDQYDAKLLFENDIEFRKTPSGKMRRYFSVLNFFDFFRVALGSIKATIQLFSVYPDVVFSKGSYASVPVVFGARLLRIPVIIHDSDVIPGRANLWAAKFAYRIAISYPQAAEYFEKYKDKVALVGQPVRRGIIQPAHEGAYEFLGFDSKVPTILILGGSQGSTAINGVVLTMLPTLVTKYQIIHQTGEGQFEEISTTAAVILEHNADMGRYKPIAYLNDLALRMSVGVADLVISRAGSGSIFEIALWRKPAILIPIPEAVSRDQRKNAFAYARAGGAVVIEQENITSHLLESEIDRIMNDEEEKTQMISAAEDFRTPDAGRKLAEEIIRIALSHEV